MHNKSITNWLLLFENTDVKYLSPSTRCFLFNWNIWRTKMIFCPIVPYFWTNKNPLKFNWQNPDRYIFQPVEIWLTTQGSLRQTKFFLSLSDISQSQSSKKKWVMSEFFFLYVRVSDSCWLDNRLDEASYTLTADVQNMYKCIFIIYKRRIFFQRRRLFQYFSKEHIFHLLVMCKKMFNKGKIELLCFQIISIECIDIATSASYWHRHSVSIHIVLETKANKILREKK